jgi:hypothetical protein
MSENETTDRQTASAGAATSHGAPHLEERGLQSGRALRTHEDRGGGEGQAQRRRGQPGRKAPSLKKITDSGAEKGQHRHDRRGHDDAEHALHREGHEQRAE